MKKAQRIIASVFRKNKKFKVYLEPFSLEVPPALETCIQFIESNGVEVEGIFRKTGAAKEVTAMVESIANDTFELKGDEDVHLVAATLKGWLVKIETPLLPNELHESFMKTLEPRSIDKKLERLTAVMNILPPAHKLLLGRMCVMLEKLVERSDANKMTLNNVAIVFAPILFRFNTNDLDQMIRLSDQENTVVKLCVEHNALLFVRPQMRTQAMSEGRRQWLMLVQQESNVDVDAGSRQTVKFSEELKIGGAQLARNIIASKGEDEKSAQMTAAVDKVLGETTIRMEDVLKEEEETKLKEMELLAKLQKWEADEVDEVDEGGEEGEGASGELDASGELEPEVESDSVVPTGGEAGEGEHVEEVASQQSSTETDVASPEPSGEGDAKTVAPPEQPGGETAGSQDVGDAAEQGEGKEVSSEAKGDGEDGTKKKKKKKKKRKSEDGASGDGETKKRKKKKKSSEGDAGEVKKKKKKKKKKNSVESLAVGEISQPHPSEGDPGTPNRDTGPKKKKRHQSSKSVQEYELMKEQLRKLQEKQQSLANMKETLQEGNGPQEGADGGSSEEAATSATKSVEFDDTSKVYLESLLDKPIEEVIESTGNETSKVEEVVIEYQDGTRYEGGVIGQEWYGTGRCFFSNGNYFYGEVDHDMLHGFGTMIYANGDKFVGSFVDDLREGKGVYTSSGGDVYEGEFMKDQRSGFGCYSMSTGDKYEGSFDKGVPHGFGVYTFASGEVYEGEFQYDEFHGTGKYVTASGMVYEGEFVNGERTGMGVCTLRNGDVYTGEFVGGKFNGEGEYRYVTGGAVKATFVNGKPDPTTIQQIE